jgi:hypothetical protein
MDLDRLVSRWKQIGAGGRRAVWHLHLIFNTDAPTEFRVVKQQTLVVLARAFNEFRVAAKTGFDHDRLGNPDQRARAQSHQFAG